MALHRRIFYLSHFGRFLPGAFLEMPMRTALASCRGSRHSRPGVEAWRRSLILFAAVFRPMPLFAPEASFAGDAWPAIPSATTAVACRLIHCAEATAAQIASMKALRRLIGRLGIFTSPRDGDFTVPG